MKTKKLYRYIGYNGTITSPVLLEGINHRLMYELRADSGHYLTNGEKRVCAITVEEDAVDNWVEIEGTIDQ